jgi:hypothetical protein
LTSLLVLGVLIAQAVPAFAATIQTDLWVYEVGDTITVTGEGFGAEETVELVTTSPTGVEIDRGTTGSDAAGALTYGFVLDHDESGIYDVVATGLSSGLTATTQFDPVSVIFASPAIQVNGATLPATVSPGAAFTVTGRFRGDVNSGSPKTSNVTLSMPAAWSVTAPATKSVTVSSTTAQTVDWTVTAPSSGSATGTITIASTGATSSFSVSVVVTDATAPTVNCGSAPAGWSGTDVSIACTASDSGSGLANPGDASFSLSTSVAAGTETANASTDSRNVCDNAGNCTQAGPITGIKVDKRAPQLSDCDAADGLWHDQNVTLGCDYTDGGSGPSSQTVDLSTNVNDGVEDGAAAASAGGAQACDAVGNCAASPADIGGNRIDRKDPVVSCGTPDGLWHQGDVTLLCTASDAGSGLADPSDASFSLVTSVTADTEDDDAATGSRTVSDAAGNSTTAGPVGGNQVDRKAPAISCDPAPTGWQDNEVTIDCTAADGGSGLADATDASFTLTTSVGAGNEDGDASTDSYEVCDDIGNCATAGPFTGLKVDRKAPDVSCDAPDGLWHAGDVSLGCTATDGGSGLDDEADASFDVTTNVALGTETGDASTDSRTVYDAVGNSAIAGPISGNQVDRRAPGISCASPDGLWHADDVSLGCTASDGGSGLNDLSDASFDLTTSLAVGAETDDAATDSRTVYDAVGNSATAGPIGGNQVDKKAPELSCDSPDGLWHADDVSLGCTATDGGSGLVDPSDGTFDLTTSVDDDTETDDAATDSRTVYDAVGNSATAGAIGGNKIDKKAPEVFCASADGIWHGFDVTLPCTASDGGSGLADADEDAAFGLSTNVAAGSETDDAATHSRSVSDAVGNSATAGPIGGNQVDKKAPTYSCDTPDGLWHAGDVTLLCTAQDGGSGLADTADASFSLVTSVGTGTETDDAATDTYPLADAVGNATTAGPIGGNQVDKKAPTYSCDAPPTGWHAADVSILCTAQDGGSGLADAGDASFSLTTSVDVGTEDGNASTDSRQVCDDVGNCAMVGPFTGLQIDRRAPTLSCDSPDGLWHATNVTLGCAASDAGSGLVETGDASFGLSTTVAAGVETSNASTGSRLVSDAVGNSATAGPIGGNKVDRKGPQITLVAPANGATYLLHQSATPSYGCSDGGSGLASCLGPATIDTSSPGSKGFQVSATDAVGNPATLTNGYSVQYSGTCVDGAGRQILQPVDANGSSVFKKGSTIPVKFRVCDASGTSIGGSQPVTGWYNAADVQYPVFYWKTSGAGPVDEQVLSTTPDTQFRWDPAARQWVFNLNSKNLASGYTYVYRVYLNDGTYIQFQFALK